LQKNTELDLWHIDEKGDMDYEIMDLKTDQLIVTG